MPEMMAFDDWHKVLAATWVVLIWVPMNQLDLLVYVTCSYEYVETWA